MRNVLIIDDHPVVRQGMSRILTASIPDLRVVEADDRSGYAEQVAGARWDLVMLDLRLGELDGLSVLRAIHQMPAAPPVLIVSMYSADQFAARALAAGASGYVEKASNPEELVTAVRTLLGGRKYVSAHVMDGHDRETQDRPHDLLSDREYQVLRMIGSGRTVSEIATTLTLSVKTVSTYRGRILEKMRLRTNAELMRYVIERKLVQ